MSSTSPRHRLSGLKPDNLLAFLALVGLLRALEACDLDETEGLEARLHPRASWDLDEAPLRPVLHVSQPATREQVAACGSRGLAILARHHDFGDRQDLNYASRDCRTVLDGAARSATAADRGRIDLLASLMSDAAVRQGKATTQAVIDPTPLCLLFGQGHQHFLGRLAEVPEQPAPPPRGKGRAAVTVSAEDCLTEALFQPWQRQDPTSSFRWDPDEDVRYALMAGDPTDDAFKARTQHGANRLAAVGLAALTGVPEMRRGRVRLAILGGQAEREGFTFAWPVWRPPTTLAGIRALLAHPDLRRPNDLRHLGVEYVFVSRRISVGKYMNFTRAQVLDERAVPPRRHVG